MATVVMAFTAAADKTTAAFFIDFPFTKIKRQAKAFVPITRYALSVPSRGTQQKKPQAGDLFRPDTK